MALKVPHIPVSVKEIKDYLFKMLNFITKKKTPRDNEFNLLIFPDPFLTAQNL